MALPSFKPMYFDALDTFDAKFDAKDWHSEL
jgi:hypothetical protein